MLVVNKTGKGIESLPVKLIDGKHVKTLSSKLARRILKELAEEPSYPMEIAKKLKKAQEKVKEGFVYLHVFSPCPVGWRIDSNRVIEVCRTAVRTNYFPLWEAEDGKPKFTLEVANPKPVTELTKLMRKFSHLKEDGMAELQKAVDERYALIKSLCDCYK